MKKKVILLTVMMVGFCINAFAGGIDRIDIYDNADNHLLFITFEYDAAGNNIGRTVYASDSTFLRTTKFTKDAGGSVTAENSVDYDSNLVFTTRITPQTSKADFSIKDQFNMDMLGAPMTYTNGASGEYSVSQGGATVYKQKYVYAADGKLTQINYTDPAGTLLYYAKVTATTGVNLIAEHGKSLKLSPAFRFVSGGKLLVTFSLAVTSRVTVELFTPTGRLFTKTESSLVAGHQTITLACNSALANGAYILRISTNGSSVFQHRLMIAR